MLQQERMIGCGRKQRSSKSSDDTVITMITRNQDDVQGVVHDKEDVFTNQTLCAHIRHIDWVAFLCSVSNVSFE